MRYSAGQIRHVTVLHTARVNDFRLTVFGLPFVKLCINRYCVISYFEYVHRYSYTSYESFFTRMYFCEEYLSHTVLLYMYAFERGVLNAHVNILVYKYNCNAYEYDVPINNKLLVYFIAKTLYSYDKSRFE